MIHLFAVVFSPALRHTGLTQLLHCLTLCCGYNGQVSKNCKAMKIVINFTSYSMDRNIEIYWPEQQPLWKCANVSNSSRQTSIDWAPKPAPSPSSNLATSSIRSGSWNNSLCRIQLAQKTSFEHLQFTNDGCQPWDREEVRSTGVKLFELVIWRHLCTSSNSCHAWTWNVERADSFS